MFRVLILFGILLMQACSFFEEQPESKVQVEDFVVEFPRFPHNTEHQSLRKLLVFYSPDDLNSNITWESIGYPDSGLFLLHNAFPKLKYTVQLVAENRYLYGVEKADILKDPVAQEVWKEIQARPELRKWMEFGNHGYYHSPVGAPDLDHHEFSGVHNPKANDFEFCRNRFTKARDVYAQVGLDNDQITVMRFPGWAHTEAALEALLATEFLAFFGRVDTGHEFFHTLPSGQEILVIPDVGIHPITYDKALVNGIETGKITSQNLHESPEYIKALGLAFDRLETLVHDGGVINLFDHWWVHSWEMYQINGVFYQYEMLVDLLKGIDEKYGASVWWGFGSELARWAHFKKNAKVHLNPGKDFLEVSLEAPSYWKEKWNFEMSLNLVSKLETFPEIQSIEFLDSKERESQWQPIEPDKFWTEENRLYFNFNLAEGNLFRIHFNQRH